MQQSSNTQSNKAAPLSDPEMEENLELSELLPLAGHFDIFTLLGKNGELIRIIELEIEPNNLGSGGHFTPDIRASLRSALLDALPATNCNIAVQFYTVRDFTDISLKKNNFSNYRAEIQAGLSQFYDNWQKSWNATCGWQKRLQNKIYIALVHRGLLNNLQFLDFLKMPLFWLQERRAKNQLNHDNEELAETTELLCKRLAALPLLRWRKLGMKKHAGIITSELLAFYHYLLNFRKESIELAEKDASALLSTGIDIDYFFNEAHLLKEEKKSYVVNFSIKSSYDLSANLLDKLINSQFSCVISEAIIFDNGNAVLDYWREYHEIYQKSRWHPQSFPRAAQVSGASTTGGGGAGGNPGATSAATQAVASKLRHCWHQTSITVFADNYDAFIANVQRCVEVLHDIGVQFSREDFYMPAGLLTLLPANNRFLSRLLPTFSNRIGGYAKIAAESAGNYGINVWGEPLALLPHAGKYGVYHLNPHHKDKVGHILVCDSDLTKIRAITDILFINSLKYAANIVVLNLIANGDAKGNVLDDWSSSVIELNTIKSDLADKLLQYDNLIEHIPLNELKLLYEEFQNSTNAAEEKVEPAASSSAFLEAAKLEDLEEQSGDENVEKTGGAMQNAAEVAVASDDALGIASSPPAGEAETSRMVGQIDIDTVRAGTARALAERWESTMVTPEPSESAHLDGNLVPAATADPSAVASSEEEANPQLAGATTAEQEGEFISAVVAAGGAKEESEEANKIRAWLREKMRQYWTSNASAGAGSSSADDDEGKHSKAKLKTKGRSKKAEAEAVSEVTAEESPQQQGDMAERNANASAQLEDLLLGANASIYGINLGFSTELPEFVRQIATLSFLNNVQEFLKRKKRNILIIRGGELLLPQIKGDFLRKLSIKLINNCSINNTSVVMEYVHNFSEKFSNTFDKSLLNLFETQILLSNRQANVSYRHLFNFSDEDIYELKMLSNHHNACIIRQHAAKIKVAVEFSKQTRK